MSLMHLHRPEIRMLTASNRKAQVLNSRRVDGPQRNRSIRSCRRRVSCAAPRRSSSVSDHRVFHTHPSVTSVSVLAEFPDSCGKPRLIASAVACHASQVAYGDRHHWRGIGGMTFGLSLLDAGIDDVDIYESTTAVKGRWRVR
jgi:hypothetical protein